MAQEEPTTNSKGRIQRFELTLELVLQTQDERGYDEAGLKKQVLKHLPSYAPLSAFQGCVLVSLKELS